jgi:hypothetical protein
MNKVTEARKKILEIFASIETTDERLEQIKEIVLNDDEWNKEPSQALQKHRSTPEPYDDDGYKSGLDVVLDTIGIFSDEVEE